MTKLTRKQAMEKIEGMYGSLNANEKSFLRRLYFKNEEIPEDEIFDRINELPLKNVRLIVFQMSNSIVKKMKEL